MLACLHTKSEHSPGYGTATIEGLVHRAVALGYGAAALTDVENLYGQVKFHHAARQCGLRAITGVELRAGYGPGLFHTARCRTARAAREPLRRALHGGIRARPYRARGYQGADGP